MYGKRRGSAQSIHIETRKPHTVVGQNLNDGDILT
jgi:hypothetical protein